MSKTLLSDDSAVVHAVPYGEPVYGAVTSGPTKIGNFSVVGDVQLPGSFSVTGSRYQVINKQLAPGETYQGEPGVMMYMSPDVTMQSRFAGCASGPSPTPRLPAAAMASP